MDRLPSSGGTGPVRSLRGEPKLPQTGEVAEFARDRARKIVVPKIQLPQAGEVAELARDRARKIVVAEGQPFQGRQVTQVRRDRARQVAPGQF